MGSGRLFDAFDHLKDTFEGTFESEGRIRYSYIENEAKQIFRVSFWKNKSGT